MQWAICNRDIELKSPYKFLGLYDIAFNNKPAIGTNKVLDIAS